MGQSKRIYQEEHEWDAWSHFEEEGSFEPIKSKSKKIKKMKKEKPFKRK